MKLTKGEVKKIISEELEKIKSEDSDHDSLVEEFSSVYTVKENKDFVDKEAVIDLLNLLEENTIPADVFKLVVDCFPQQTINKVLKEALEK